MYLSVYPSIHLPVCPYVCQSIHLSMSVGMSNDLSVYVSVCLSLYPSVYLSLYLSICPFAFLSSSINLFISLILVLQPFDIFTNIIDLLMNSDFHFHGQCIYNATSSSKSTKSFTWKSIIQDKKNDHKKATTAAITNKTRNSYKGDRGASYNYVQ